MYLGFTQVSEGCEGFPKKSTLLYTFGVSTECMHSFFGHSMTFALFTPHDVALTFFRIHVVNAIAKVYQVHLIKKWIWYKVQNDALW